MGVGRGWGELAGLGCDVRLLVVVVAAMVAVGLCVGAVDVAAADAWVGVGLVAAAAAEVSGLMRQEGSAAREVHAGQPNGTSSGAPRGRGVTTRLDVGSKTNHRAAGKTY